MSQKQVHKQIVRLRWYKATRGATKLSFDEDHKPLNENNIVKLMHGTSPKSEWINFLSQCQRMGFVKLEVDSVYDYPYTDENKVDSPKEILKEVHEAFHGKIEEKPLTTEQKKIAELEAIVKELASKKEVSKEIPSDLKQAREDYIKAAGKKGHHSWDVNKIREEIKKINEKVS